MRQVLRFFANDGGMPFTHRQWLAGSAFPRVIAGAEWNSCYKQSFVFGQGVNGRPMQLAMGDGRITGVWRGLLGAVAFGAALGVMGPFGSQTSLDPVVRYSFWMIIALAGFGACVAAERALSRAAPNMKTVLRIAAIAAVSAVPMTFFVAWAIGEVRPGRTFSPLQLLGLFPYVALVQLLIARVTSSDGPVTAAALMDQPAAAPESQSESQSERQPEYPPGFLSKLPAGLRHDILALEAEDHYLRVHTRHGSVLVLMRLADAAALIDSRLGLRVHRSWWVARGGVRAVERMSGRVTVRLADDTAVPVSRSYMSAVLTILTG